MPFDDSWELLAATGSAHLHEVVAHEGRSAMSLKNHQMCPPVSSLVTSFMKHNLYRTCTTCTCTTCTCTGYMYTTQSCVFGWRCSCKLWCYIPSFMYKCIVRFQFWLFCWTIHMSWQQSPQILLHYTNLCMPLPFCLIWIYFIVLNTLTWSSGAP